MAVTRKGSEPNRPRRPPATTPEARENQLVALAFDLAEKQLTEGTASAMVISHYLKLGTEREKLERSRLEQENRLLQAKVEQLGSMQNIERMYSEALNAMRSYQGVEMPAEEYDDPDVF